MRFQYDPHKSFANKTGHGIDFQTAQALWTNSVAEAQATLTNGEMGYYNIGKIGEVYWTAVISYRGSSRRIISVYRSNPRQIELYERTRKASAKQASRADHGGGI